MRTPKRPRTNVYEFGKNTPVFFRDTEEGWKAFNANRVPCVDAQKAYEACKGDLLLLEKMVLTEIGSENLGRLPRFVIKPSELMRLAETNPTIRSWYNEGISEGLRNKIKTTMETGSSHTKTATCAAPAP